jgi:hypothetical protein
MIVTALLLSLLLCVVMIGMLEIGRRIGNRRLACDADGSRNGLGAVEGAIFSLMGLLLAFTFSGAASRFEDRRDLINQETNDIGTAWLRIDLLPADVQPALRENFRRYLDARIASFRLLPDFTAAAAENAKALSLQTTIWDQARAACQSQAQPSTTTLVLTSLNAMIDITTTRATAQQKHPPYIIFALLVGLSLGCSLLVGYGMAGSKTRSRLHSLAFAIVITVTLYVIVDLEFPRGGLIRIDGADQSLVDLRASMGG